MQISAAGLMIGPLWQLSVLDPQPGYLSFLALNLWQALWRCTAATGSLQHIEGLKMARLSKHADADGASNRRSARLQCALIVSSFFASTYIYESILLRSHSVPDIILNILHSRQ